MSRTATVTFQRRNTSVQAPIGANLLDFAESQGIPIPAMCRGGSCGTCRVKILRGSLDQDETHALSPRERCRGIALACSARITGDLTIDA